MKHARGLLDDRGARSHFRALAAGLSALALAGCAAPERPAATAKVEAQPVWGDRTVAVIAPKAEPTLAYFAPGQGAGALYVWDAGEDGIARGNWRLDGGLVCASLDVLHRDPSRQGALRVARPVCLDPDGGAMAQASYRGDVFQLNGKSESPYILSAADNERLQTVLFDAARVTR